MEQIRWVTSWEQWRTVIGHHGSRQRDLMEKHLETHPAVMYWGDSWFSTPLYLNLARQSALRIDGLGIIIGEPGAEAAELFSASKASEKRDRLISNPFDVLCLSAGGNDCLDEHLAFVFSEWKRNKKKEKIGAADAFALVQGSDLFSNVYNAYHGLLTKLERVQDARANFKVLAHTYVPIELIGVPADLTTKNIGLAAWLKGKVGPWLWEPMQYVLPDKDEGRTFARLLLGTGFHTGVLKRLASEHAGLFSVVDLSTHPALQAPGFWHDEIHPTEDGFAALAKTLNERIASCLPVRKRDKVGT